MTSTKSKARFAGLMYMLLVFSAPASLLYLPSHFFVKGNATATVLNITSADRLYADWQSTRLTGVRAAAAPPSMDHLEKSLLRPEDRTAPLVTVLDGASHALAFLGSIFGQRTVPLGMDRFGQSGDRANLYDYAGIDAGHIVNAALLALDA